MCGIAGFINTDGSPASREMLQRMTNAIAHRGPDGEGAWVDNAVALGHRRLAIIDPSPLGRQPMYSHDDRYVLVYNGEVYNFKELKVELQASGYVFQSGTDSEVVLAALGTWGTERALARFNGMFAFALWDRRERQLTLARDRCGIKPLYYTKSGAFFAFGSEQKALLASGRVVRTVDRSALMEYFTFQNIFTDRTLLQDVRMVPAGCYLTITPDAQAMQVTRYWDYDFQEPSGPVDAREYQEELDRLFQQAVSRQLITDVELGSYLSGGMDSGSITAIAARSCPYIKTFTCGFDLNSASGIELNFDERSRAEYMSYLFKTEHYEMVLKAGDMERVLPRLIHHMEEPRVGQSYPNFYAAQLASKFVKVVLSGAGGDELFGGYPWRYYRAVVNTDFDDYVDKYYEFWQRLIPGERMPQVFAPIWNDVKDVDTREIFRGVFKRHADRLNSPEDYINHSLYFEAKTFLHGLLVVEDKLSMAHGLETRVPYLDNDLVDFSMRCPVGLKLRNLKEVIRLNENEPGLKSSKYFARTRDGKQILRDVMEKYIPADIVTSVKQGFSAPDASWFKGDSMEYVRRSLFDEDAPVYEYLDRISIRGLVEEHLEGRENRRLLIWSLLSFNEYLRQMQ